MMAKRALLIGLIVFGGTSESHAGWVIEQTSVFTNSRGDESPAEPATMRLSQGRLRVTQPNSMTIQDCVKERFAIFVPERNTYWTGTFDEYVSQTRAASEAAQKRNRLGQAGESQKMVRKSDRAKLPEVDEAKLPEIVIRKTNEQAKIGGYDTTKHLIESDGRVFQEIWITTAFNVNDDMDPELYMKCRTKMARGMRGRSGLDFNALYRSKEYLALSTSGFAMKTLVHHIGGSHLTEVRSITRAEVLDSDFAVPPGAAKVALNDLFAPPEGR